jgi:3-oxoacyl-[acyl-carrier-protein] synthase-1
MSKISIIADNIISPLGWSTEENFDQLYLGNTGLAKHYDEKLQLDHVSSIISPASIEKYLHHAIDTDRYTRLETLVIHSIASACAGNSIDLTSPDTIFIFTTTKGNISLLDSEQDVKIPRNRRFLNVMAKIISEKYDNPNQPIIISNACISGVLGIITAKRLLESDSYKNVVLCGFDEVSRFTLSGFSALHALSDEHCRPFDINRKGINLGDAIGTMLLSKEKGGFPVDLIGGAVTNDANHISGPSRTGEGMYRAIDQTLVNISADDIEFISTHGTATLYNDEMESKALNDHGFSETPVNSMKGFWGHTLGAAGIIESIICYQSILKNKLIVSPGYEAQGTEQKLNILKASREAEVNCTLKTASGFGGCNAALAFKSR